MIVLEVTMLIMVRDDCYDMRRRRKKKEEEEEDKVLGMKANSC